MVDQVPRRDAVLFVFGTRPEAIKMAPVVRAFESNPAFHVFVCVTAQHREMLDQVLEFFELTPQFDLDLMAPDQTPAQVFSKALTDVTEVIMQTKPRLVFVQGDTTTAAAGALAAFLARVPVAHVEAGLRSFRKDSPFPEEMNRTMVGDLATLHFAPVELARENLAAEGIRANVHVVGNTVVDALFLGLELIKRRGEASVAATFPMLRENPQSLLVTIHRRESFGEPLLQIFEAIREIAAAVPDLQVVFPVHPNPRVRQAAEGLLASISNVHLVEPLEYHRFIWMMSKASVILTDSGGVQEEAPSLGVPVLVAREVTERPEGIAAGVAKLVGADRQRIVSEVLATLQTVKGRTSVTNPYGDGKASSRIVGLTRKFLEESQR